LVDGETMRQEIKKKIIKYHCIKVRSIRGLVLINLDCLDFQVVLTGCPIFWLELMAVG
jgi:hypothetical protein